MLRCFFGVLFLATSATVVRADEAPDYAKDVAPVLKKYCAGCHNDADHEGKFSLESFASLQKGTEKGPAVLPGDAASSRLIRLVTGAAEPKMPPEGEAAPSEAEINTLRAWIDAGAKGPEGQIPDRLSLVVPHIPTQTELRPIAALDAGIGGSSLAIARYGRVEIVKELRVGDAASGRRRRETQVVQTLEDFPGKVTAVHYRGTGKLITASGVTGLGGVATIWEWPLGQKLREFKGHLDIMLDAEISPDGKTVATCSYDKRIILWNAETGEQLRTLDGHNGAVYDVAFSPDSQFLVSASADDTCKVWRVLDGERLDTLGQPLKEQYACQFSPDGQTIVAGGADNRIRVWKFISSDKPRINPLVHARFAHEGPIVALDFTPDGKKLVSVAEDRTIKVWDTSTYEELQLIENEPEVSMALAVIDDQSFVVGRLDGTTERFAIKPSVGREKSSGSSPMTPVAVAASDMNAVQEQEPNNAPAAAQSIAAPAKVSGSISGMNEGQPDRDLFKFQAKAGEEWVIEVDAARQKSKLDSFVEVLDAQGNRVERVLLQAVRDSYFTFRGKDADQAGDFRLFNWEEMELNELLYCNGEVVKLWLYPRGPDSGFNVYPGSGNRWGYFDTTPLSHALGEPCYIVQPYPPGTELVPNGLPVFTLYHENDDESHRELGADSRVYFTAPADGDYVIRLRDVRGLQGEEFKYTLNVRPRTPGFKVTLTDLNPNVNKGSGKEFRVKLQRMDDFEGPVTVDITGVPAGFSVTTPIMIEAGQVEALGMIWAAADAQAPAPEAAKATVVMATAEVRPGEFVTQPVDNLGEIKLEEKRSILVKIVPAEGGAQPVNPGGDAPLEFVIEPGQTIMLKVVADRGEYKGLVKFGNEDSGRNLPHGVIVDNIGLNGLMMLEDQNEREFFLTASKWVPEQKRLFHLTTQEDGRQTTLPVLLHVKPRGTGNVAGN